MKRNSNDTATHATSLSRRKALGVGIGAISVGLAGCAGSDPEDDPSDEGGSNDTTSETDDETVEPVDPVPEDANCAVCNMKPAEYPDWNAQLVHAEGERAHFCSPGCLTAYYADPGHFDAPDAEVDAVWATDVETRDLVDGLDAAYVLETDAERIDAPMMKNPLPFAEHGDAVAYVDEYDDLTEHDIVGLDAFDHALARTFRPKHLPETDEASVLDSVSVPDDAECAVCNMVPAEYPDWNAQLTHEDGERAYFCSPGCLTAYHADPGHFDENYERADLVGVWAHDLDTGDLIDGTTASYVLEMDGSRHEDMPMKRNPLPFAERAAAHDYVDEYDDLTESDVVSLAAFDRDLAAEYRSKQFEDD